MSVVKDNVIEGFLCPICMQDLNSITQLQAHFEEQHESEDRAVLQSLKGFFNKARKKFLSEDDLDRNLTLKLKNPFIDSASSYESYSPWEWEPPSQGPARLHTTIFRKIRSARIDSFVAETNKLLIRLDKLLTQMPSDPVKRKAHEKDIVPWADDKDVLLCPFCARSFNLARRRHHCRLCGAIMCDECSLFLSFVYAQKLVSPIQHGKSNNLGGVVSVVDEKHPLQHGLGSFIGSFYGLRQSGSHGSLNSLKAVIDSVGKEQNLRICSHCLSRLSARDRQVEQRSSKPLLSVYYEKLMEQRNQLASLLPQYLKMVESLREGETTYNLHDAEELRVKILRLSDSINMIAQKIRNFGLVGVALENQEVQSDRSGSEIPAEPCHNLLQQRIHSSTVGFLKDYVLGLPKLPSAGEVSMKKERRRKEADARLAAEREATRQAEERAAMILKRRKMIGEDSPKGNSSSAVSSSSSSSSAYSTPKKKPAEEIVSVDTGWGGNSSAHNVTETDDPVVQQMNIIRNYIKQAREASRYEEVALLETNLKELQLEYKNQQRLLES